MSFRVGVTVHSATGVRNRFDASERVNTPRRNGIVTVTYWVVRVGLWGGVDIRRSDDPVAAVDPHGNPLPACASFRVWGHVAREAVRTDIGAIGGVAQRFTEDVALAIFPQLNKMPISHIMSTILRTSTRFVAALGDEAVTSRTQPPPPPESCSGKTVTYRPHRADTHP